MVSLVFASMAAATLALADLSDELDYREKMGYPVEGGVNVVDAGEAEIMNDTTNTGTVKPEPKPASTGVAVFVNGEYVAFPDQKPFVNKDGRTMVPVRFVAEELGAKVAWDQAAQKVIITRKDKAVVLWINQANYTVNGAKKSMDTKPVLVNKRTMVPLRFISEALGAQVQWDGATRTVYVALYDSATNAGEVVGK